MKNFTNGENDIGILNMESKTQTIRERVYDILFSNVEARDSDRKLINQIWLQEINNAEPGMINRLIDAGKLTREEIIIDCKQQFLKMYKEY